VLLGLGADDVPTGCPTEPRSGGKPHLKPITRYGCSALLVDFSKPAIHRDPHTKSIDTICFDEILFDTTLEEINIPKPDAATPR
jgi:hypothetical protein